MIRFAEYSPWDDLKPLLAARRDPEEMPKGTELAIGPIPHSAKE
jgi:hypothetical protein